MTVLVLKPSLVLINIVKFMVESLSLFYYWVKEKHFLKADGPLQLTRDLYLGF